MKRTLAWGALAALSLASMWWVASSPEPRGPHGPEEPLEDRRRVDTLPDPPLHRVAGGWPQIGRSDMHTHPRRTG